MDHFDAVFKKEIVCKINDMDHVEVRKNISDKFEHNRKLLMDLYTAYQKEPFSPRPVVILIHGEAKSVKNMKDAGQYCSLGKVIAASGLNAVTFNHRMLSDGFSMQEVIQDINDLIQYVINNADTLKINKNKIALWSFSGGVPFGMYVGLSSYFDDIKCIISYYGFGDFNYVSQFFSTPLNAKTLKDISLLKLIQKNAVFIPPMLIARAGLDAEILNESIDKFIVEALRNNLTIDILNHATGQHAFDLFNDNDRTHEIIIKSLDFLKMHLK